MIIYFHIFETVSDASITTEDGYILPAKVRDGVLEPDYLMDPEDCLHIPPELVDALTKDARFYFGDVPSDLISFLVRRHTADDESVLYLVETCLIALRHLCSGIFII